jgi:hypothetical protein
MLTLCGIPAARQKILQSPNAGEIDFPQLHVRSGGDRGISFERFKPETSGSYGLRQHTRSVHVCCNCVSVCPSVRQSVYVLLGKKESGDSPKIQGTTTCLYVFLHNHTVNINLPAD